MSAAPEGPSMADPLDAAEAIVRSEINAFDEAVEALVVRAEELAERASRLTSLKKDGEKRLSAARQFRESVCPPKIIGRPPSPGEGEMVDQELLKRIRLERGDGA